MKILSLALVAALAASTLAVPAAAQPRGWHDRHDRHDRYDRHDRRWNGRDRHHHRRCWYTWRHHHRVRVCR